MLKSSIDRIKRIRSLPIIEGYYLVLGGGKIGTSFTEHARKHSFPLVLLIDNDMNAPASSGTEFIKDANALSKFLEGKLASPLNKERSNIYFYCAGLNAVPFILSFGMPEYIVPAIPCHVTAYLVKEYFNCPDQREQTVTEMCITPEDKDLTQFFDQFTSHFPENIVAGLYPEQGITILSYAGSGEICPDGCPGPEKFCPNFRREKPKTITNYLRDLLPYTKGWVFESYQTKPGIGAMRGADMKQNLLEMSEYVYSLGTCDSRITRIIAPKDIFFIATTCNCHGVVSLFRICSQKDRS
ncbi:hypothetical protein [Methanomethylovorans sp.]|uniref:hypothetical protein n=1 Tax=Methanomethylovorans sp. TaxID=2758717 RepID=UPI00351C7395